MSSNPELERWNTRFAAADYVFGTAPNAFLASQAHRLKPGMTALAIADGEGRNGVWLAQQGLQVTGFDFSPNGLAKAQRLASERQVQIDYQLADITDWDWDAKQYDVIAAIFFQFARPAERARIFNGLMRALKPGGFLLLQGYRVEQLKYGSGGPSVAEQLYSEALLRESFAALDILHLASHDDEIEEGAGHKGLSALIDMVGRR